jgi:beta-lactamase regulating signal transducer with metallopeptidase domain
VVGGSLELSIVVKATLVVALGILSVAVMRRTRASRRYLALAATFAVLLALPLAVVLSPPVGIDVTSATPAPPASASSTPVAEPVATLNPAATQGEALLVTVTESRSGRAFSPVALLRIVWLAGVALFLLPIAAMAWQLRGLRRTGLPWVEGDALAGRLARAAAIRRRITVLLHEDVDVPMTCGIWRPAIRGRLDPAEPVRPAWPERQSDENGCQAG